jgi:7-cyano-7-deazaguanine reductase
MSAKGPSRGARPRGRKRRETKQENEQPSARDIDAATLADAPLGHATDYPEIYSPSLLFAVPRAPSRAALGIAGELPFSGVDVWTAYELTWLDARGRPQIAIATLVFPAPSPAIIESKSMKLYLGSFAQTRVATSDAVAAMITRDVSHAAGAAVEVVLDGPEIYERTTLGPLAGESLDGLAIDDPQYEVDPSSLSARGAARKEALTTDLFRSVCPVTGQPDIASVQIAYRGPRIERSGLLRYLVSYRRHPGFHEHCVERIFMDIAARCRPKTLTVCARFLRRGGIDINPIRTNAANVDLGSLRTVRQ